MGWRDQSTPLNQTAAPSPTAAKDAPAPAAAMPAPPPKTGWQSQSSPVGQPKVDPSATPQGGAPVPGQPGNETLPWFNTTQYSQQPTKIGAWLNTAIDAGTGGLADTAQGYLNKLGIGDTDKTTEQLRTDTQNLKGDIGPLGTLSAELVGYGVGPGKLGVGAKLAELGGSRLAARIAGSAAENAAASGIGTLGHGGSLEDAGRAATVGGLIGAATGAIPGARGSNAGDISPTASLNVAKKAAFDPLTTVKYDPGHFGPDFDAVTSSLSSKARVDQGDALTGAAKKISQEMADKFRSGDTITADDIAGFQRTLGRAGNAPGAGPTDPLIARQYSDALDGVVQKAAPTDWGQVAPGTDVSGAISAANTAANKANTSADIDKWIAQGQRKPSGVPDAVDKALTDNPQFYQTHPDLQPMLQDVANSKPGLMRNLLTKGAETAAGAGVGAGIGYLTGGNPLLYAALGGSSVGSVLAAHALSQGSTNALVSKLAAARHLNATGEKLPAFSFSPGVKGFGPMLVYGRQGLPGIGASGAFMSAQ